MKIQNIETFQAAIPLHTPFKTALRTVTVAESIVVKITCDDGIIGWGEAPPTHVITGDSLASIDYVINGIFKPLLVGESILCRERMFEKVNTGVVGNPSAKAAMDMAIYDCIAQHAKMPLTQFLGGYHGKIETDYTVSVNSPEQMAQDAQQYVNDGFTVLKVKVGKDLIETDIKRIQAIREQVGTETLIRLDANQGWSALEAVKAIRKMEDLGLNIELIEQPVKANDLKGLKYVTENTTTPIMADESVFSANDAKIVLEQGAADLINIKLMKAGGIHEALKIAQLAKTYGVDCMVGSMIETKIGITAAAHFAASQPNVTRYDFDAPLMLSADLVDGGIIYNGNVIDLGDKVGLGIKSVDSQYIVG
ncbi:dipeptide epimerase [Virgibacillus profundi]|uniref:Dipeptide epimerase n=1 Tax=Virgibacillus profundi TaxID=2024555 RepID=A0A2A2III0_9BACI|nr:dipeptide epimerase [Virgibacillus profundi]PAV31342.1 dipeptide epimerase [Virgibacillus profundi]PXY55528.1 dipeptide epimerase [Virgibacillus profundi]